ncbi:MAG: hypothetical protein ACK48C_02045 [Roseiflexaceae bacterium]
MLLITTHIFSISVLDTHQLLMAIAWPSLALHLARTVWYTHTHRGQHSKAHQPALLPSLFG